DPATAAGDASLVFIGQVRSPWRTREACPKNMAAAREAGGPATGEIEAAYRDGLAGLGKGRHAVSLAWLGRAPRHLIGQTPRQAPAARGPFALRSPLPPNPRGLHVARLTGLDAEAGILTLEAIDVLDGTPVVDVKPYYASTDAVPEATIARE